MIDDMLPEPEPAGALVPPPRTPPTALATADALPPRREPRDLAVHEGFFRRVVHATLNALDEVGDSIAHAIRLR